MPVCLLELVPRPRAWEARAVRAICGGGRACCLLAFSFPRAALSLVARSLSFAAPGFPSTGSYDDPVLDRFRLPPAGRGVVFSHAYRLRRADVNGASVEYRFVSRAASALFLLRLAFAIVRPVIGDIRPVSRIAGRGGRTGRLCLLTAIGAVCPVSFLSSACSFLTHRHLLGLERFRLSRLACFALCVLGITRRADVVGRLSSSCVGMWGASSCFVAVMSHIASVPFLVLSHCPFRFYSLFAPSCDTAGGEMLCGCRPRLARRSFLLLAVRGADRHVRLACYHFGVFSPGCVLCGLCV